MTHLQKYKKTTHTPKKAGVCGNGGKCSMQNCGRQEEKMEVNNGSAADGSYDGRQTEPCFCSLIHNSTNPTFDTFVTEDVG